MVWQSVSCLYLNTVEYVMNLENQLFYFVTYGFVADCDCESCMDNSMALRRASSSLYHHKRQKQKPRLTDCNARDNNRINLDSLVVGHECDSQLLCC